MRVVLACKALVVEEYRRKLSAIAQQSDVDLIAVTPQSWQDPAYAIAFEQSPPMDYELVLTPLAFNGSYHLYFFPELPSILDRFQPDLLHIDEEPYNLATFLATWQAARRRIPTVFFAWQNIVRRYPPPFRWMESYVFRIARCGIGGTHAAERALRTRGFKGPTAVIPQFGVDPERFAPPQSKRPDGHQFTIGYAGRFVAEKGLLTLLRAAARLPVDYRIVLIGDGPQRAQLQALARELKIEDRLEIRDPVPSSSMPLLLHEFDVLVLPSISTVRWIEQFGRILVEAMASGVPVIGSTCGEIPGVIDDAGLVFDEGDEAQLCDALCKLAGDAGLRRDLSERGRKRVLDHYTHQRVAEETVGVYGKVLQQQGSLPPKRGR